MIVFENLYTNWGKAYNSFKAKIIYIYKIYFSKKLVE